MVVGIEGRGSRKQITVYMIVQHKSQLIHATRFNPRQAAMGDSLGISSGAVEQ